MLNTISHQGNADENHNEILYSSSRMSISRKTCVHNHVEKLEPSYTAGGNVKWCNFWKSLAVSQKVKHSYLIAQLFFS